MTNEEKERATNKLLHLLSQHPADGLTARELEEQSGGLGKEQVISLLGNSSHAHKTAGAGKGGPINNPAHVWKLRVYVPGSENGKNLSLRISSGSKV